MGSCRCPCRVLRRRNKRVHFPSAVVPQNFRGWHATNRATCWVHSLCSQPQLPPVALRTCSRAQTGGRAERAWCSHLGSEHLHGMSLFPLFGTFFSTSAIQVFFDPTPLGIDHYELSERAAMLPEPITIISSRLIVHIQTEAQAVDDLLDLIKAAAEEKKMAGFVPGYPPAEDKSLSVENPYREIDRRFKPGSR